MCKFLVWPSKLSCLKTQKRGKDITKYRMLLGYYVLPSFIRRHDIQHKDIQYNDTQHTISQHLNNLTNRNTQYNDTQYNSTLYRVPLC
jgi:hypothetical protein